MPTRRPPQPTALEAAELLACDLEGNADKISAIAQALHALDARTIEGVTEAQHAIIRTALLSFLDSVSHHRLVPRARRIHEILVKLCKEVG